VLGKKGTTEKGWSSLDSILPNTAYSEKIENRRENICFYEF
jgi:hypothetical protein